MRIGYANVPLDGRQDVGPLGVSALVFDFGTSRQALIIIDGNNMVEGLAQRIANRVKQVGIQEVLVVTNDNHILTGIFNVEGGYYPVGARDGDLVVESSAQAVERAVHDLSRCEIRVVTAEVNDVPLLGDGLSVLLGVTIKALQRFKRSLVAYLLYSFLLSALGTSFSVG
jgi:predicted neutral ceramidase superfamily lipid hydrolase